MSDFFENEEEEGTLVGISDEPTVKVEYANKVELDVDQMGVPVFKFYFLDTDFDEGEIAVPKRVIAVAPYVLLELQEQLSEATEALHERFSELESLLGMDQSEDELQN
jgi:hypothetical protein